MNLNCAAVFRKRRRNCSDITRSSWAIWRRNFFTHDQMALLQRFVSERGGGFLMLGGAESFREGNYAGTPIASMLPVYLDRAADAKLPGAMETDSDARRLAPAVDAIARHGSGGNKRGWRPCRRLTVFNPVQRHQARRERAGHGVGCGRTGHIRRWSAQRFGLGRTAALMIGDMWRWGLRDEADAKRFGEIVASTGSLAGVGRAAASGGGGGNFRRTEIPPKFGWPSRRATRNSSRWTMRRFD